MTGSNRYAACRHCGRVRSLQARRLCFKCYHSDTRDLYPPEMNQHGQRRALGLAVVPPTKLPTEPTRARPGSEQKITEMRERLERDEHLHHRGDA